MGIYFNSSTENSYITLDDTLDTINNQFINFFFFNIMVLFSHQVIPDSLVIPWAGL